jgi:nucleoid-associated protein YgaU
MGVYRGSRYENVGQEAYTDNLRGTVRGFKKRDLEDYSGYSYTEHTVVGSDRLDTIAALYYGEPLLWWIIAEANPELIFDPLSLTVNSALKIPKIFE